jgi:hypothetical protein
MRRIPRSQLSGLVAFALPMPGTVCPYRAGVRAVPAFGGAYDRLAAYFAGAFDLPACKGKLPTQFPGELLPTQRPEIVWRWWVDFPTVGTAIHLAFPLAAIIT